MGDAISRSKIVTNLGRIMGAAALINRKGIDLNEAQAIIYKATEAIEKELDKQIDCWACNEYQIHAGEEMCPFHRDKKLGIFP